MKLNADELNFMMTVKEGDMIGVGSANKWTFVTEKVNRRSEYGMPFVTLEGYITLSLIGGLLKNEKEVIGVRDKVISETERKMKRAAKRITNWSYDQLKDDGSEPGRSIVRVVGSVKRALTSNYSNLNYNQFVEIADYKLIMFEKECKALWKKVPQLVPSSFLDAY